MVIKRLFFIHMTMPSFRTEDLIKKEASLYEESKECSFICCTDTVQMSHVKDHNWMCRNHPILLWSWLQNQGYIHFVDCPPKKIYIYRSSTWSDSAPVIFFSFSSFLHFNFFFNISFVYESLSDFFTNS